MKMKKKNEGSCLQSWNHKERSNFRL